MKKQSIKYNMLWNHVQHYLDKKGWSLNKLSQETRISQSTLEGYKYNNVDPTFGKICKIADALGISLDDLREKR